jgi:3-hydroxyisobutyrate dehydrogenase
MTASTTLVQLHLPDEEPELSAVLENVWHLLRRGLTDRKHGFHLPTVSTWDPLEGPMGRKVVLRGVDRGHRLLRFHCDARSLKIEQIRREPRVSLTFYDVAEETQVRVQASAEVHTDDDAAEAAWQKTRLFSRRCYLAHNAPGTVVEAPTAGLSPEFETRSPSESESQPGRENFSIVLCRIRSFDWMFLSHMGHRRARFVWDDDGALACEWLQP